MLVRVVPGLFPPDLVVQIKLWLVNCQPLTACPCRVGAQAIWCRKSIGVAWWPPLAVVRYGAGSMTTPFALGITAVGSFRVIRISPPRRDAFWTSMPVSGKAYN